jgi:hypothetical protein
MQYLAAIVGVWGAWIVLRTLANERAIRMRAMHQSHAPREFTLKAEPPK